MGSTDSLSTRLLRSVANLLISSKNNLLMTYNLKRTWLAFSHDRGSRIHLAQEEQWPHTRRVSSAGRIVKTLHVGGLHHRDERVPA